MQSCHSNICFVLLNIRAALFRFVFILLEQRLERGCGRGHLSPGGGGGVSGCSKTKLKYFRAMCWPGLGWHSETSYKSLT